MLNFTLTLEEANAIVAILGRQPYEQVESLIKKLREQAMPQLDPAVDE